MTHRLAIRRAGVVAAGLALILAAAAGLRAATPPEAGFRYNIISITGTAPGEKPAVTFSVTDPTQSDKPYDLANAPAFTDPAARLALQIGWNTRDFSNKGSGVSPALPIQVSVVTLGKLSSKVQPNGDGTYTVTSGTPIPTDGSATGTGVVLMEGHPVLATLAVPVKSAYKNFLITDVTLTNRRQVVDINKCKQCHQPHLSLHGGNRTDEINACVTCHNPNMTDINRRLACRATGAVGPVAEAAKPETPIDFKFMVHAIHAAERRHDPLVIIGFAPPGTCGTANDFSHVDFPRELRNCLNCHIDGTFELPLKKGVLATTAVTYPASTGSTNADPGDDLNITPTAAVCSACHDGAEVRRHMIRTGGASFAAKQADIDSGRVRERCVNCHGKGKEEDVRKAHEIRSPGTGTGSRSGER